MIRYFKVRVVHNPSLLWNMSAGMTKNSSMTYGCFLKWWYPTTMDFPTKNDHFGRGVALGVEFEIGKSSHLQPLAESGHLRPLAATCGHLTKAATCGHLRPLAESGHLRPLAATRQKRPLAATLKFLPVIATAEQSKAPSSGIQECVTRRLWGSCLISSSKML